MHSYITFFLTSMAGTPPLVVQIIVLSVCYFSSRHHVLCLMYVHHSLLRNVTLSLPTSITATTNNHTHLLTSSIPNTYTPLRDWQTAIPPDNAHPQHGTDRTKHQRYNTFCSETCWQRRDTRVGAFEIKPVLRVPCGIALGGCVGERTDVPVILRYVQCGSIVIGFLRLQLQGSFDDSGNQAGVYMPFNVA